MSKPKFKPEITRVKLNPEQAVLSCTCVTHGNRAVGVAENTGSGQPTGGDYTCSGGKNSGVVGFDFAAIPKNYDVVGSEGSS